MTTATPIQDPSRQGIVMMSMMVLFGIMSIMTITVFIIAQTDIRILTQYKRSQTAFFNAEAGLQYAKSQIERELEAETLVLDSEIESVSYTSPGDFDFDPIRSLTRLSNENMYYLTVTGHSANAQAIIEAAFKHEGLMMNLGVYGSLAARIQPNGNVLSYRSADTTTPVQSTGEAGLGSNGEIIIQPGVNLDGTMILGQDSLGTPATGPTESYPFQYLEESIDSDPLGATGGELENATIFYRDSANNNNEDAQPAVRNDRVNGSIYLPPGNYYFSSFSINPGQTLEIGGTPENPVNIFFESSGGASFRIQPTANIVFSSGSPAPTAFRIFSVSENDIIMMPNLDVHGLIYAPNADIWMQPNGNFHGAAWGRDVRIQPGGNFWIDLTLLNQFMSTKIEYTQWKEVRQHNP